MSQLELASSERQLAVSINVLFQTATSVTLFSPWEYFILAGRIHPRCLWLGGSHFAECLHAGPNHFSSSSHYAALPFSPNKLIRLRERFQILTLKMERTSILHLLDQNAWHLPANVFRGKVGLNSGSHLSLMASVPTVCFGRAYALTARGCVSECNLASDEPKTHQNGGLLPLESGCLWTCFILSFQSFQRLYVTDRKKRHFVFF